MEFFDTNNRRVHRPDNAPVLWRPSGYAIVTSPEKPGQVLIHTSPYTGAAWCLPGGEIHAGESIRDGVAREVREETRWIVRVKNERPLATDERGFFFEDRFYHALIHVFLAATIRYDHEAQIDPSEVDHVAWVNANAVDLDRVHHIYRPALQAYLEAFRPR